MNARNIGVLALEKLDLLIVLDPKMNQTAQFADYVMPPKLVPEIPALTYDFEELESHSPGWGYPLPYGAYREALVDPPEGSDVLEDWEFFYLLAREMKLEMQLYFGLLRDPGDPEGRFVKVDMNQKPTTDEFFEWMTEGSRIPLSEIRRHEAGQVYEDPDAVVQPRSADCTAFLELANPVMMEQLDEALAQGPQPGGLGPRGPLGTGTLGLKVLDFCESTVRWLLPDWPPGVSGK